MSMIAHVLTQGHDSVIVGFPSAQALGYFDGGIPSQVTLESLFSD